MSRGHGQVQNLILTCLRDNKDWAARELANHIFGRETPPALVSIRRALRALAAEGLAWSLPWLTR
jgi:hypothetical protein